MEEIIEDVKDFLLEFQDDYSTGEPDSIINSPDLTLIYNTARSKEMYIAILNSIGLRNRLQQNNVTLTYLDFTDHLLILECTLPDGQ